jgi:hypothetical protein
MNWERDETKYMFSLEEYLSNYGEIHRRKVHLQDHLDEFEDFRLTVPFAKRDSADTVDLNIVCCPEDRRCAAKRCRAATQTVCPDCEIPFCQEYEASLKGSGDDFEDTLRWPPARALSNDLMFLRSAKYV